MQRMETPTTRFAYFARGIDGLYLPQSAGFETIALVRANTPEAAWAEKFLTQDQFLCYRLSKHTEDPYPSTESLLQHSDIGSLLKRHRIPSLLLSSSCSEWMHGWSQNQNLTLIATEFAEQQKLEHKIWFDRFLTRHRIARPASQIVTAGSTNRSLLRGKVVVQRADSLGGEGTFFLNRVSEFDSLVESDTIPRGERCLARKFISGRPFGITLFIAPGSIRLSAVRLQCYYPENALGRKLFAGVQWIPTNQLSDRLRGQVNRVMTELAKRLYGRRFFGFANIDFMADDRDRVHVIECNPRMSAATPQLLHVPALSGMPPLGQAFLAGFYGVRRYPRNPQFSGLPNSDYAGSTLDLMKFQNDDGKPSRVCREYASGLYALKNQDIALVDPDVRKLSKPNEFGLVSFANEGQTCCAETTLGSIISNKQLFDPQGRFTTSGRRLLAYFQYL